MSSLLSWRTNVLWLIDLIMRAKEIAVREKGMCPVIWSKPRNVSLFSRRTEVLWLKVLAMRTKDTEEREERMCFIIGEEPLHSQSTNDFMVIEADNNVLFKFLSRRTDIIRHKVLTMCIEETEERERRCVPSSDRSCFTPKPRTSIRANLIFNQKLKLFYPIRDKTNYYKINKKQNNAPTCIVVQFPIKFELKVWALTITGYLIHLPVHGQLIFIIQSYSFKFINTTQEFSAD